MDVLRLLKKVRAERSEALAVQQHINELRLTLLPSGIRYDTDRVQTSPTDRMLETVAKLDELERKQAVHLAKLTEDIIKATEIVNSMPTSEYRQLLMLRYLTGDRTSWETIAFKMGYSVDHVKGYLHYKAIEEARNVNTL